jgi:CheY-like chemotaxis protein/DNA-binding MarR family transcriptional regulator
MTAEQKAGSGAADKPPAGGLDALLVDDEELAAREMAQSLSKAGLRCAPVCNPWQALRMLAGEQSPRVAVIDIRMPELDGLQLVERLNSAPLSNRAEIILVSGNAGFEDAVAALRLGVRRLLCKPLRLADLVREVKTACIDFDLRAGRTRLPIASGGRPEAAAVRETNVETLVAQSRWRERFFPREMLSDHCWRMILELYQSRCSGRQSSLTGLALVSGLPMATAVRKIHVMRELALVVYATDPADRRRTFVSLSDLGLDRMEKFLERLEADLSAAAGTARVSSAKSQ